MSALSRIRQIPAPVPSDIEREIARLREVTRWAEERDDLIRSLRARGLPVKELAAIVGVSHQRVCQIVNGTNGHEPRPRGGRNGNGST